MFQLRTHTKLLKFLIWEIRENVSWFALLSNILSVLIWPAIDKAQSTIQWWLHYNVVQPIMIAPWLLAFCHLLMWTTITGLETESSPQDSCCKQLKVDSVIYNFLGWDTRALPAGCQDSCSYTSPESSPGTIYCFKTGHLDNVCMASSKEDTTTTTTITSSTTTTTTTTITTTTTSTTTTEGKPNQA